MESVAVCLKLIENGLRHTPQRNFAADTDKFAASLNAIAAVGLKGKLAVVFGREAFSVVLSELGREVVERARRIGADVSKVEIPAPAIDFYDTELNYEERLAIDWCLGAMRHAVRHIDMPLDDLLEQTLAACVQAEALEASVALQFTFDVLKLFLHPGTTKAEGEK